VPAGMLIVALTVFAFFRGILRATWNHRPELVPSAPFTTGGKLALGVLLLWTCIKLAAGAYDLAGVPTYWDDSFNNWNMRGKMFYVQQELVLSIPVGNGVVQTESGVSSYPPTVSMMKTWLADVRGAWEEPLVNGVHFAWLLGLIATAYFFLRRNAGAFVSALGAYALVSLPLLLIHGSNPYADIFVAAHVLVAAGCVLQVSKTTGSQRLTWLRLAGLSIGLLAFTKNEALLLYAPVLAVLLGWQVFRGADANRPEERRALAIAAGLAATVILPWLAFKWSHGLSFGNAKAVSSVSFGFSAAALQAIWFHLSHEPNWLLIPLLLPVLGIANGKRGWNVLTLFVAAAFAEQTAIFTLTSLSNEAILQTGLSRGLLHIAPVAVLKQPQLKVVKVIFKVLVDFVK
ncbi:MAG TPA: hypothetical protein PKV72_07060, partial [Candidatus Peribacteria bacterium]|nr:hypothetical protein [Candidatus Peribacteria bacterium]